LNEIESNTQNKLMLQARILHVTGMTPSSPAEVKHSTPRYQLRSRYTPPTSVTQRPRKPFHKYKTLGEGAFGVVSKVVDFHTGEIWAVREIKANAKDDKWRMAFKTEVRMIASLHLVSNISDGAVVPISMYPF
jgi:serine/threonine protein kinase